MDLAQARHAFITGGASGLGLAMADALAARGLRVTIADIDAETLASVVASRGEGFRGSHLDTRDRESWRQAKAEAEVAFGPVDVLINNAGIAPNGSQFADMDPDSFDRIVAINLTGVFNGVSTFAGDMRGRGRGHIVNTSSQAGLEANVPGTGAYSVAKFGVTALTERLRAEMAPHGVGVTGLYPGYVETNLAANTLKVGGDLHASGATVPHTDVTPAHVGAMVVDAIERDAPCIITHTRVWRALEKHMAPFKDACEFRDQA